MLSFLSKYYSDYLKTRVVFILDLILTTVSAFVSLLILSFFTNAKDYYTGTFAVWWMAGAVMFAVATMLAFKSYRIVVRHMTLGDLRKYVIAIFCTVCMLGILMAVTCTFNLSVFIALLIFFFLTLMFIMGVRFIMLDIYSLYKWKVNEVTTRRRVLVYGTSDKSIAALSRFRSSRHYEVVGFISDNRDDNDLRLSESRVYSFSTKNDFAQLVRDLSLGAVLFTRESEVRAEDGRLVAWCSDLNVSTLITPSVDEVVDGKVINGGIRKVKIEDLLGRPEIKIAEKALIDNFEGQVVMVTGAAGSIGSELCRQLASLGVSTLVLYDNAETPMHNLRLELEEKYSALRLVPIIGDVRHLERLDFAFRSWHPQTVFHAAAYKHVPLMEENPCEAILTNVLGSRNVADKCVEYGIEKMVMISTDKAVNPTNIMGCTKRLAEIYVQSMGLAMAKADLPGRTRFVTTRFGNVLGSNGSVIPRFREQIENGGPVTVTHPDINRFFMTIPEACSLVMEAATMSTGNQIFVFDMGESVKISDLAKRMIELAGLKLGEDIQIAYTGLRPGEKLYEEVLANAENTEPTGHNRIRIAKVRDYEYADAVKYVNELASLASAVRIPDMVKLMKKIVPEFKSRNSKFELYDLEGQETNN